MKSILIAILFIGILFLSACGGTTKTPISTPTAITPNEASNKSQLVHYEDTEFGFSIDYPKGWLFEKINPNEIGIKPKDKKYNQVQISYNHGKPMLSSLSKSQVAATNEASLQQFFDMLGASNLNVFINEPTSGKWDWVANFTVICEDTPLQGSFLIKETEPTLYTILLIQMLDWPEGQEVINSFEVIVDTEVSLGHSGVENYLAEVEVIINKATDIALEVSSLYKTAKQLDPAEVVRKCAIYGKEYDDLLLRLAELACPQECSKLREYAIDGISYSKQEVTEFSAAFATGDMEHLYKAESYYDDAQRSIALAAGEWERLTNINK